MNSLTALAFAYWVIGTGDTYPCRKDVVHLYYTELPETGSKMCCYGYKKEQNCAAIAVLENFLYHCKRKTRIINFVTQFQVAIQLFTEKDTGFTFFMLKSLC